MSWKHTTSYENGLFSGENRWVRGWLYRPLVFYASERKRVK